MSPMSGWSTPNGEPASAYPSQPSQKRDRIAAAPNDVERFCSPVTSIVVATAIRVKPYTIHNESSDDHPQ